MNYQKEFNNMLTSLKACSGITVTEEDFYVKEEVLPSFFKKFPYSKLLGEEIKVLNDNKILWIYSRAKGDEYPMGETHLISIEEIVSGKSGLDVEVRIIDKKESLKLLPFDNHPNAGDGIAGCLRFFDDQYEIWLCDANLNGFKMNLTFPLYLKNLIQFKAVYGWQYLFTELDLTNDTFKVTRRELKERLNILSKCFPDVSVSSYIKKL